MTGLTPSAWETGSWADIAGLLGGPLLRVGVVLGGVISAFGMFNALVMSYSRLPLAMAQDGMLPGVFSKLQKKSRAPWVAIVALAMCWAMCLGLGFARLVTLDILLYGCWSSSRWQCCASVSQISPARFVFPADCLARLRSASLRCYCWVFPSSAASMSKCGT